MHENTREIMKSINNEADKVFVEEGVPLSRYINSGLTLEKTGKMYFLEGNIIASYLLLTKLLTLFIERLPKHKDYKAIDLQQQKLIKNAINRNLPFLENLKIKLIEYLDNENMKNDEMNQPELVESIDHIEEISPDLEKNLKNLSHLSLVTNDTRVNLKFKPKSTDDEHSKHNECLTFQTKYTTEPFNISDLKSSSSEIVKDSVPSFNRRKKPSIAPIHDISSSDPKIGHHNSYFDRNQKPTLLIRDSKFVVDNKKSDSSLIATSRPKIDRQSKGLIQHKVESIMNKMTRQMRNLVIPSNLEECFLEISEQNNRRNKETCGILAGTTIKDYYMITHLLIPKQTGSANSCCCDNEEDLFTYQVSNDLITLGWIHTHPSQSCFMSSIDLHTQYGYQCLLPESIAIVISIKYKNSAVYGLTNHGLQILAKCTKTGFHLHDDSKEIFHQSLHTIISHEARIKTVDMR